VQQKHGKESVVLHPHQQADMMLDELLLSSLMLE
jgi:hypothetical protein